MSGQVSHDVLRRKVAPPPPAPEDVPISSSRAVRLAVTRAADKTHGIAVSVLGLREEAIGLDDLIGLLPPKMMLIGMQKGADLCGIAGFDAELRAALIEAQTIGFVLPTADAGRPITLTDSTMAQPMLIAFLRHLGITGARTALDGWSDDAEPGNPIASARAAGLLLPEITYRMIRLTIDLQAGDRQGEFLLALPDHRVIKTVEPPSPVTTDWQDRFQKSVNAAPVALTAELGRFKIPLMTAQALAVDQVLPLQGCALSAVKLRARDGKVLASGRLGQSGGFRAIRVDPAEAMKAPAFAEDDATPAALDEADVMDDMPTIMEDPMGPEIDIPSADDAAAAISGAPDMDVDLSMGAAPLDLDWGSELDTDAGEDS